MPFRIALSGLNAAQTDLNVTAHNIANTPTPGFRRQSVARQAIEGGGVSAAVTQAAEPGASLAEDIVTQMSASYTFKANLKLLKLEMKHVVKMQVFLVGDPAKEGRMDFTGFMQGYRKFFGTPEQPNLPARTTVQVAALPNPGWLVEIEVTVVAPN